MKQSTRIWFGIVVFFICLYLFSWWGLFSLLFVFIFIGWDSHEADNPFKRKKSGIINVSIDTEEIIKLMREFKEEPKFTDPDLASKMCAISPNSFVKMQDILESIANNDSDEKIVASMKQLLTYLKQEEYSNSYKPNDMIIREYINSFSMAFPNWQAEYSKMYNLLVIAPMNE